MVKAFLLLFLGHLLGDFVFQNSKIASLKSERFSWLLYHSIILWGCSACVILPLWTFPHLLMVSGLTGIHFGIDMVKLCFRKHAFSKTFAYFLLDQGLHVLSILMICPFLSVSQTYLSKAAAFLIITMLMNTYFLDISIYMFHSRRKTTAYSRDWIGYAFRAPSFFLWIWNGYAGMAILLVGVFVQLKLGHSFKQVGSQYGLCFLLNLFFLVIWRVIL